MLCYILYYGEPWWLVVLLLLVFAWGVLNVILFFKLWGACDDIKRMASNYQRGLDWSDLLLLGRKEEAVASVIQELLGELNGIYKKRVSLQSEAEAEKPELYSSAIEKARRKLSIIGAGVLPAELDSAEAFIAWKRKVR